MWIHTILFMDYVIGAISLYDMGVLYDMKSALYNTRSALCDIRASLYNPVALYDARVMFCDIAAISKS